MTLDPDTRDRCQSLRAEANTIAVERQWVEWRKWASKGVYPSAGLRLLQETEWDQEYAGLAEINTPALWAEVDRMRESLRQDWFRSLDMGVMLSAVVAKRMPREQGEAFIRQTVESNQRQSYAKHLLRDHPRITTVEQAREFAITDRAPWRMRACLEGSGAPNSGLYALAEEAGVLDGLEKPLLSGRDLLLRTARKPGPWMGALIKDAEIAQACGDFRSYEDALAWADSRL